jgi:toxin-antitoxin system PIN domain toxin
MRALLDVNVLIALLDKNHSNHMVVSDWFASHIEQGWASCPLTQNGCVRILSQPKYPNTLGIAEAVKRLHEAVSTPYHQFVADDISLLDDAVVDSRNLSRPGQITDVYLLALAVTHGARLVTLDKYVPLATVREVREESLIVI